MGHFIEVVIEPSWNSVEEFDKHAKRQRLFTGPKNEARERVVECTCCSQKAPHGAAALIKVEDQTPYNVNLSGDPGEQLWICADCFHYGVRPKYVRFGDIYWNKEGRKIKKRTERHMEHPW